MLNVFRKFLRPTLREQLEAGVREALRRYAERHAAPNLRVYVSTDLVPEGVDHGLWARDESEHLRRFSLQWAEDNHVPRAGLRIEVILLDTKREFAFVKPLGLEPPEPTKAASRPAAPAGPPVRMVERQDAGEAVLQVVTSPGATKEIRIADELVVGRKDEGTSVVGLGDRYMSGRHARFHLAGHRLYVTDLDSKNRTFVNERPIAPHERVGLQTGDQIRMGTTTLQVGRVGA